MDRAGLLCAEEAAKAVEDKRSRKALPFKGDIGAFFQEVFHCFLTTARGEDEKGKRETH